MMKDILDINDFKTGAVCVTSVHGKRGTIDYEPPSPIKEKEVCPKCGTYEFFIDNKRKGEHRCRLCFHNWR